MMKICYANRALQSGKRNSLLHVRSEKKLHKNYTKFYIGGGKEYKKEMPAPSLETLVARVGGKSACVGLELDGLWSSFQPKSIYGSMTFLFWPLACPEICSVPYVV